MNQFDQIENRIKEIIEKGSDLWPRTNRKAVMISQFCEALRQQLIDDPECLKSSPSEIKVFMPPEDIREWNKLENWMKTISDAFLETVIEMNCKPEVMPEFSLTARNSLINHQIAFSFEGCHSQPGNTGVIRLSRTGSSVKQKVKPDSGRVLLNLEKTIPMEKAIINIGRRNSNDIVISDLRVSREHAQIRKTREGYMLFDVGSSGGTFLNGTRITSSELKSGDVISLAGYTLIFTHEKPPEYDCEQEITANLTDQKDLE